ncbi:DUF723 domain-containing protein [Aeromonas sp. R6-2]|uniref:DUF723 domain-containing protein n=1 Tax=Aeromonas sp. R6-2 TaxID=3138472 RepID=UPI0034A4CAA4
MGSGLFFIKRRCPVTSRCPINGYLVLFRPPGMMASRTGNPSCTLETSAGMKKGPEQNLSHLPTKMHTTATPQSPINYHLATCSPPGPRFRSPVRPTRFC